MRKQIAKSLIAALMITSITGTAVFADDVTNLTNQKAEAEQDLENFQSQLAYLLVELDELEIKMADKNIEIENANADLAVAQQNMEEQYDDMKLRIKYMYEDQSTTIAEAFLTAENMSDALNKAEYVQQVYEYDRGKLDEMAETASKIKALSEQLEADKEELQKLADDATKKQATLYTAISDKEAQIADISSAIVVAQEAAAAESRRRQQAAAQASKSTSYSTATLTAIAANNDSSVASRIVSMAYQLCGVPYVYGGASTSGFDCSGLIYYIYRQMGMSAPRSSSQYTSFGSAVGGLSQAQPGDIVCYPGHVGIYIGGGQIIHAPVPGDVVKVASANILPITAIRRGW